jgi:hypothetical protein
MNADIIRLVLDAVVERHGSLEGAKFVAFNTKLDKNDNALVFVSWSMGSERQCLRYLVLKDQTVMRVPPKKELKNPDWVNAWKSGDQG